MKNDDEQRTGQCPDCGSNDTNVPVITIDGTTLWRCTNDACSRVGYTESTHQGMRETPDPTAVENVLENAAEYRGGEGFHALADEISRLYRDSRTREDRTTEPVPEPQ